MRNSFGMVVGAATLAVCAGTTIAQTTITQWNMNGTLNLTNPVPNIGTGTASLFGLTSPGASVTGSPLDITGGGANNAWNTTGYPAQGTGSGTGGVQFDVSTVGYDQVQISYDARWSNTGSKYTSIQYSTAAGTPVWVDLVPQDQYVSPGNTNFVSRTVSLAGLPGVSNNPDFKFRVVTIFDPTTGNTTYSQNAGTNPYGTTGTIRYDLVTVAGNPIISLPPSGNGTASPSAMCPSATVSLNLNAVTGANPPSTTITVTGNLTSIGGGASVGFTDFGGGLFSLTTTAPVTPGNYSIPVTISDNDGPGGSLRSSTTNIPFAVGDCSFNSTSTVVISEVFGGGGTLGGTFDTDYVELYNRGATPVDLSTYSLQYSAVSAVGANSKMNLSGTIQPGGYYLVQVEPNPVTPVNPLTPTPDLVATTGVGGTGALSMSQTAGRVSLVNDQVLITGCSDATIVDKVGYGAANCFEGAGPAGSTTSTTAAIRNAGGAQDSDQNFNDFLTSAPSPNNSGVVTGCWGAPCVADFDDGSSTGTPDGGVTIDDLIYYLGLFEAGDVCADVDDGSGTNTLDGGVTIDDLIYYLGRFEAGC